jgi:predicted esterase YcpF (UPF0227 family)
VIELQKLDDVYIVTYDTFGNASEIIEKIEDEIEDIDDKIFIGTSLGGYFAAQLALRHHAPAVMINPLFQPEINLQSFVGVTQINFVTDEINSLTQQDVDSYKVLPPISSASDFSIIPLVIIAEDDELIPAKLSAQYFEEMIIFKTSDGGHRYNKPKQLMSVVQNYLNQAFVVSDLNHE